MPAAEAGTAGVAAKVAGVAAVIPKLGKPTRLHLRYAEELGNSFSGKVESAAHEPLDAVALVYAMLLSPDEALRTRQLRELSARTAPGIGDTAAALWPEVAPVGTALILFGVAVKKWAWLRAETAKTLENQRSRRCLSQVFHSLGVLVNLLVSAEHLRLMRQI